MRLHKFDLNLLTYLDALLSEKSVSRAAARVSISQPAMSEALSRLREYFDDELLVHVAGRNMILTPLATSLTSPLRETLLQLKSALVATPHFVPAHSDRMFSVVLSDYAFDVLLGRVLKLLSTEAPRVRVELHRPEVNSCEQLRSAGIDLLVVPRACVCGDLAAERLYEDFLTCVVWSENRLVGAEISLEQYMALGHVSAADTPYDRWFAEQYGFGRKIEIVLPDVRMVFQALEGTDRIAVAYSRQAWKYVQRHSLRLLPPPFDFPPLEEYMQWHRRHDNDPGALWFRKLIKSAAAGIQNSWSGNQ